MTMIMRSDQPESDSMKTQDYLWDKSGAPDPEIVKLESQLEAFRQSCPAPIFPAIAPGRRWTFFPVQLVPRIVTATAVLVLGVAAFLVLGKPTTSTAAGWDISNVAGTPRIGAAVVSAQNTVRFGVGQLLETDSHSRISLHHWTTGWIEVEPGTRLRLLTMAENLKRIALERGTIHAYIWATPGQFVVDTPSALTVDLGCAYTLHVDDSGAGLVRTSRGWVGFKFNGREAFIPAGAADATRPKVGPGTPYFEDATPEFRSALAKFDFEDTTPQTRAANLATVIRESRKDDALTLWHLLSRVDEAPRGLVYDRLRGLAPPPAGVTREGILRLEQPMLDAWWNALSFDDISVWRRWERSWPGESIQNPESK